MSNITVRHAKVSNIADHPVSVNAGEIVPSDWNADHNVSITSLDGVPIGSVTPSTGTFTTVTANDKVSLKNGTAPTSGDANTVHVYSSDLRTDATIPSVWTEGNIAADVSPTANRAIPIRINGVVYYLLASSVDYSTSPTLDLNFAASTSLDSRVTFTRASNGTYFNSAGTLTTAGNNVARLDYNPSTLAARGLLIEEQRTNSIRNNTMQGGVAGNPGTNPTNWISATVSGNITGKEIVAIGTENGIDYVDVRYTTSGSVTFNAFVFESATQIVAANGQTWTSSLFVKLSGGAVTNVTFANRIMYRTAAGASVTTNDVSFIPTSAALSTQKSSNSFTASGATIERVTNQILVVATGASDFTLRIGMPQLEQGAFATSVIPTTAAAATRNADVASVTTLTPWYNATEGTVYAQYSLAAVKVGAPATSIWSINDGSTINEITVRNGTGLGGIDYFWSNNTVDTNSYNISANVLTKTAAAYKADDAAVVFASGQSVIEDASCTVVAGLTQLNILSRPNSTQSTGWMQRISYYPQRLPNATLQTLTT